MKLLIAILFLLLDPVPSGKAFLNPLQQRDSILIADQLEYGFTLEGVKDGTQLFLPDFSSVSNDTLTLVRDWRIDTLKTNRKTGARDIQASIVIAPFEPGEYHLPTLFARRVVDGQADTLEFEAQQMNVTTIQIDTATFVLHDIKGQIKYPVTFREVLPWLLAGLGAAGLAVLGVILIRNSRRRKGEAGKPKDPPYVVALRKLDRYRGNKYWAADRQKAFYSGVTDTLKEYIDARFGVDAPEMTTAELFDALKGEKEVSPEMYNELKDLFERADFVKFAKMVVSDEENATVLPVAVKFVTDTYQTEENVL